MDYIRHASLDFFKEVLLLNNPDILYFFVLQWVMKEKFNLFVLGSLFSTEDLGVSRW